VPTSRRPRPGDKPRRPRVAGMRKRTAPGRYDASDSETIAEFAGSEEAVATEEVRRDNGFAPATKSADPSVDSGPTDSVDHPDLSVDAGESDDALISEWEAVAAKPVIDGTAAVEDSTPDPPQTTDELSSPDADSDGADQEATEEAAEAEQVDRPGRTTRLIVTAVLLLFTVVGGVLSFWFFSEANALRNEGPAANRALIDPGPTSEVNGKISGAVQQVFSYDFANTAKADNAAKNLLTGQAVQQYNQLYTIVKSVAPQQKLVLTTTVQSSAVTMLQGDRAQLLLIVNQNDTRTDTGQSNSFTGQLSVGAVKQGNDWKIEQITQL
jgi:Mce-associated membrane protein